MSQTTALPLIANAFYLLNVKQIGAPIPAAMAQQGLTFLNGMLSTLAKNGATPVIARDVFPLVANQSTYTWGAGGNFTTSRPSRQDSVTGADLILNTSLPLAQQVEVPLAIYTDDSYRNQRIKALPNFQPTGIYYQATSPLGTLIVWPVPYTSINGLAVYREQQLGPFPDLTQTSVAFPDGWDEGLLYNLAKRLAGPHGRTMTADDASLASNAWADMLRDGVKLSDQSNDMAWNGRRGVYNILTGQ